MEGIKLNSSSVLEDLERIKPYIDNMVKCIENLSDAQGTYKEQFKDDISEKSSKMIDDLRSEIESVKEEIRTTIKNLVGPLEQLEEWRNW